MGVRLIDFKLEQKLSLSEKLRDTQNRDGEHMKNSQASGISGFSYTMSVRFPEETNYSVDDVLNFISEKIVQCTHSQATLTSNRPREVFSTESGAGQFSDDAALCIKEINCPYCEQEQKDQKVYLLKRLQAAVQKGEFQLWDISHPRVRL